jgi:hypothetical protein
LGGGRQDHRKDGRGKSYSQFHGVRLTNFVNKPEFVAKSGRKQAERERSGGWNAVFANWSPFLHLRELRFPPYYARMKTLVSAAALLFAVPFFTHAADNSWPQFRGPNCSGVAESAHPPAAFGPGTNQLWKVAVPSGMSSPVVWGDRIFLTAFDAGKLEVHSYARKDGKLLWKQAVPATALEEFNSAEGSPAASSCATDGRHVVSYFGSYGLICHNFAGKELWRHPLPMAVTAGGFGTGSSPTLAGRLVLINRDMLKSCSLLAVDVETGKPVWETPRPDVMQSYGSTITWKNNGVEEIVQSGSLKLKAYDPKTGAERWSLTGMPSFTCTTAVAGDNLLFFAGWAPGKGDFPMPSFEETAAQYDKNKDGAITADEVKGTPLEPFFRAQDINGDGKLTAEDSAAMKAMMAKGENVLVAVRPGGQGELGAAQIAWKQTRGLSRPRLPREGRRHDFLLRRANRQARLSTGTSARARQLLRLTRGRRRPDPRRFGRRQGDDLRGGRRGAEGASSGGFP